MLHMYKKEMCMASLMHWNKFPSMSCRHVLCVYMFKGVGWLQSLDE